MNNLILLRGLFIIAVSLLFGAGAFNYELGSFKQAGPGLFPMLVSGLLLLLGMLTVVRAFLAKPIPINCKARNMGIILGSIVGFVLLSEYLNMTLGIIFLVFCSGLAGRSYSVVRNIKISAMLLVIAFMFRQFLGLHLPMY